MLTAKYNLLNINLGGRVLDNITDITFIPTLPVVTMLCTTSTPHHLVIDDHVIIYTTGSFGNSHIRCTLSITDETHFTLKGNFSIPLPIAQIAPYGDTTTQLLLSSRMDILENVAISKEGFAFEESAITEDYYDVYGTGSAEPLYTASYTPKTPIPNKFIKDDERRETIPQGNQVILNATYSETLRMELLSQNLYILDWRFFDFSNVERGFIGDIRFMEERPYFEIPVFMEANEDYALRKDDLVQNQLVKDLAVVHLPDKVDMEKRMFIPYYPDEKDDIRITEIRFEPHFKTRGGDKWSIQRDDKTSQESWTNTGNAADDITAMGFTEDDVRYQKMKLKKSFLRLLFYDSNDVLNQNLLAYSTIFYDTGEAYTKYIANVTNPDKEVGALKGIDSAFIVHDRYDYTRSSEGFYLYLFPYDLVENTGRTIYMKVEFNHAGVGKTIPFIMPLSGETLLKIDDENFPKTYLEEDDTGKYANVEAYMRDMFLPVHISFSKKRNQFEYYFPNIEPVNGVVTIPIVEPIVNNTPTENGNGTD